MRDKLRRRYQVQKELGRNGHYEGAIALSELTRLGDLMYPADAASAARMVELRFEFSRNEFDVPIIAGQLQTSLELQCQRCLQALDMPMKLEFRLMIDASDELLRNSSEETLYSDEGYVDLFELVEDELILAIPLVALHEDSGCNEYWPSAETQIEAGAQENPFAVLQRLKTTD